MFIFCLNGIFHILSWSGPLDITFKVNAEGGFLQYSTATMFVDILQMVTWTKVVYILKISIYYCSILFLIVITDCSKLKIYEVRVDSHGTALLPYVMQICRHRGYLKSLPFVLYNGVNRVVWQGPLKIKFCAILVDSHNEVNLCSSRHAWKWKCCI